MAFTGLVGWMALMGSVWWIYGIGLKGPEPSWEAMPGKTVIQDTAALRSAGVLDTLPTIPEGSSFREEADLVAEQFVDEGWVQLEESEPSFGQAGSAAGELLVETDTFANGEFKVERVFDTGGERFPKINDSLDFLAFFHRPHHAVVEVAPLEQLQAEPGRAPTPPEIDTTRQHQYVYMIRDLGARRQPAALITTRIVDDLLVALLDAAPARPCRRREPQPTTGAGGLTRWANTCRSRRCSFSPSCSVS